jgi:iron complex transport system substrate-binding protein
MRIRLWVVIGAAIAMAVAGCGGDDGGDAAPKTTADTPSFPRTVEHEGGTTEIPAAPQRVVSASVSLTGNLLAIDAPLVASGATQPNSPVGDEQGFFRQWGEVAADGASSLSPVRRWTSRPSSPNGPT